MEIQKKNLGMYNPKIEPKKINHDLSKLEIGRWGRTFLIFTLNPSQPLTSLKGIWVHKVFSSDFLVIYEGHLQAHIIVITWTIIASWTSNKIFECFLPWSSFICDSSYV